MRAPKLVLIAVTAAALVCVSAVSASANAYRAGPLVATFSGPTHHPNCKQKWPVTVTAKLHGHRAHATAYYQFINDGSVLPYKFNPFSSTRKNPHNRLWHFYGRFYDWSFGPFGALAVGKNLKVRAVVKAGRYTAYPSYWVKVRHVRGCRAIT
jgi:hypothetical protein